MIITYYNKYFPGLFIIFLLVGCNRNTAQPDENKVMENDSTVRVDTLPVLPDSVGSPNERKLRYLFVANGGSIAYFSDGTVVGCPRCEPNLDVLFELEPHTTYTVDADGSLLVSGNGREHPHIAKKGEWQDWKMIDYKWIDESDLK